ncbi:MAG: chitinase [Natronosporangium sp.]
MRLRSILAVAAAGLVAVAGITVVAATPARAANLLANPGFEAAALAPWSCSGGLGTTVASPVHSGGRALRGAASSSDNARCSQTVTVQPGTAYTLSAFVQGSFVHLGVTGGGLTWTPSAPAYAPLSLTFTTGAAQTSVEVFLHGWFGTGTYHADDVSLDGPGTPPPTPSPSSSPSPSPTASPPPTSPPPTTGLPRHALIGYLHASFANGSGYLRIADVPPAWDIINLAFGEPTTVTSGDIRFQLCPVSECPNVESEAEFRAAIAAKQAQGKKVLLSIGGQNGQVRLTTTAARDRFVSSVSQIIDRYELDGLDVDFEGHSLELNAGDSDFRNPTTPVIVNLISALRTLANRYGPDFVLTMAPETFFVQLGYQFYGGTCGGCDRRAGAYLPVIHALRDRLTVLHVQDYNSGPITGLDDQFHTMGGADFHIAMTDMVLAGFPVANTGHTFPALREDQVAFGTPATVNAGNGFTAPAAIHQALDCLVRGVSCGGYQLRAGPSPAMRGLMTWSINWDRFSGFEFMNSHEPFLNGLP